MGASASFLAPPTAADRNIPAGPRVRIPPSRRVRELSVPPENVRADPLAIDRVELSGELSGAHLMHRIGGSVSKPVANKPGHRCAVCQFAATYTGTFAAGSSARPRTWSAPFSPIMMVGAFRLPVVIVGMIEESITRSPSTPITRHLLASATGLAFRGMPIDILAQIGFVVLVGLAAKNAILIVEFARQRQHVDGDQPEEAATSAARTRLRPILMTSFAFILGVFPLAVATGAGSEMRQSLGTAVLFGMIGVTPSASCLRPPSTPLSASSAPGERMTRTFRPPARWLSAACCSAPPWGPARSARTTSLQKRSWRRSITWSMPRHRKRIPRRRSTAGGWV